MGRAKKTVLMEMYVRLFNAYGPQKWWPAQTKFEVIIGAILTQNTNWGNVEKALANLKAENCLSPQALNNISPEKLAQLIKPSGYFNIKSKRLKNFIALLFQEYNGQLKNMAQEGCEQLRKKLLGVKGIGPETADSILLYAFDKPVFVVDAYTKRVLHRHNIVDHKADYHEIQELFKKSLDPDVQMFNEYHALIVQLGKNYCRPQPLCDQCFLNNFKYSLQFKCSQCHRALPIKQERNMNQGVYLCQICFVK